MTKDSVSTMTPDDVNEALGTASTALQTMFPAFAAEHDLAQQELRHALGAFQACDHMHGGAEGARLQQATETAATNKDACEETLQSAVEAEVEACAGQGENPNCLCNEARTAITDQTALCAAVTDTYEAIWCENHHTCTAFSQCYAQELESYNLLWADIEAAMHIRQQEYVTAMQANCLMDLITTAMVSGTPIDHASLVACDDVNVDDLMLSFLDPPLAPASCPVSSDDPTCGDTEPPAPPVGAIVHGSMVHIRNQYGPRRYLDTCGHHSCGGAGFNVVASPGMTRGPGTGTWEMVKESGSGPIAHGDLVHIRNQYGPRNYLDACGGASCGGGHSVQANPSHHRGGHMTGTWEIIKEDGIAGPIVHGDLVHLQNQYGPKLWLDACGHATCGGGYEVSTTDSRNRGNHRTGTWEMLLVGGED